MKKPKIVIFDLETLPNLLEALKVWTQLSQYPGKTMRATITTIICAGWKYYGGSKTECINAWDFPKRWKNDVNDDFMVCKKIYDVLKDTDAVVTYNGKRFDWKFLQTRLAFHGLPFLGKIHHIDCCNIARGNLFALNNKLGTIGELLADDKKLAHTGWKLWVDTYHKCPKALKLMEKYCKQDVKLLEKVFKKMLPFINNMPNHNLYKSEAQYKKGVKVCPNCGSEKIYHNGVRSTKTVIYRRMNCKDCGTWFRTDAKDHNPRTY
jgi:DNA polymerase elongation subunit (family B)